MTNLTNQYGGICKLIGLLFPGQMEVVLHDLETGCIVALEGAFSNRVLGDTSLVDFKALKERNDGDVIGPYAQENWDGEMLRSLSAVLYDDRAKPIGLLCVNTKTVALSAAAGLLASLTQINTADKPKSLFNQDWRQAINTTVSKTLAKRGVVLVAAKRSDKVAILNALETNNIFDIRGSHQYVIKLLGVSRANFYKLLKTVRGEPQTNLKNKQ
ncbi:MAG: PAS domain-containing protein [Robiginitomaculum sp.]|nr:PAS domain-containing protein [Robiginitomaculum sp.]